MKRPFTDDKKHEIEVYNKRKNSKRPSWGEQWNKQAYGYLRSVGDEKIVDEYLDNYARGQCLIIGVSMGNETQRVRGRCEFIVGLDISRSRIAHCYEDHNYINTSYVVCDAEYLPFKEGIFNFAVCRATLHHLPVWNSLKQMFYVMKDDACLCLQEPGYLNLIAFLGRKLFPTSSHTYGERPFIFYSLRKLISRAGFVELRSAYFYLVTPILPVICKYLKLPYKLITKVALACERVLCKSPLKNLCWYYVTLWKKAQLTGWEM